MKLRLALIVIGITLAALLAAWRISDARSFQLFGTLVHRVSTDAPWVALTFDDGPTRQGTENILGILERQGVPATFFFTGSEIAANDDLVARYVAAGHEIGNHSYSHRPMLLRSPAFIRDEVEVTDSLIRASGYGGPIHFRPPYGKKLVGLPWYLSRTGRTTIMWDVEPESDPETAQSAERIIQHVAHQVRPGSIILLHVMYPSRQESLQSVEGIIVRLRGEGYRFVTVSQLLGS